MFGITNFAAFLLAGILLNITPGSDTVYILGRSMAQGTRAGVLSALGISAGCLVHTLFAAFGLSIVLAQSATAFDAVKYAGAVYLIYLGAKAFTTKQKGHLVPGQQAAAISHGKIFLSGILTNVLNPKVALFFLAFLPQFIDPSYPNNTLSFLILGLTFVFTGTIWCLILAIGAARISGKLKTNYHYKAWLDRATGIVFILLGLKLAFLKRS